MKLLRIYIYIHTYTPTCIHTYIHTYILHASAGAQKSVWLCSCLCFTCRERIIMHKILPCVKCHVLPHSQSAPPQLHRPRRHQATKPCQLRHTETHGKSAGPIRGVSLRCASCSWSPCLRTKKFVLAHSRPPVLRPIVLLDEIWREPSF